MSPFGPFHLSRSQLTTVLRTQEWPEHHSHEERETWRNPQHHAVVGDGGTSAHIWCVSNLLLLSLTFLPHDLMCHEENAGMYTPTPACMTQYRRFEPNANVYDQHRRLEPNAGMCMAQHLRFEPNATV